MSVRFARSGVNWEGRSWVLNPAVAALCDQVEAAFPTGHYTDGTVASRSHDSINPTSDHRPFPFTGSGVVTAVDVGEPNEGEGSILAEALRVARDPRLKYLIHEGRMFSSYSNSSRLAWAWGPYSGPNLHSDHVHMSVWQTAGPGAWAITLGDVADHSHTPMPSELPREWADETWDVWVQRSGTDDSSRAWTFYREDLSWVYTRVIRPLESEVSRQAAEIAALQKAVAELGAGSGKPHTHPLQGSTGVGG